MRRRKHRKGRTKVALLWKVELYGGWVEKSKLILLRLACALLVSPSHNISYVHKKKIAASGLKGVCPRDSDADC